MLRSAFIASAILLFIAPPEAALATSHPGGLDANGCHAGSRPYHCHRSPNQMVRTPEGRNRLRCDLGSRSQDCQFGQGDVGRPYPAPSSAPTFSTETEYLQIQLRRHCDYLPPEFVDGFKGPATYNALLMFQAAYGLQLDGIIGPETRAALAGPVNGRCLEDA